MEPSEDGPFLDRLAAARLTARELDVARFYEDNLPGAALPTVWRPRPKNEDALATTRQTKAVAAEAVNKAIRTIVAASAEFEDDEIARDYILSFEITDQLSDRTVEALLAAYEATGEGEYLRRAGGILDFFIAGQAARNGWRIPEHYDADWRPDPGYEGNPMFRPGGTTPGHSFEMARLLLHWWDLAGRPDGDAPAHARLLVETALRDAWLPGGGLAYTLGPDGRVARPDRYWWPVTEAIGALAALIKLDPRPEDEDWYRRMWRFADAHLIDHARGGWFPEPGGTAGAQFQGKPDIYHALQADLFPLVPGLSRHAQALIHTKPLAS